MRYQLSRMIVPAGLRNNPNRKMVGGPKYITIHCTGNSSPTANANAHARLQFRGNDGREASWHYTIDKDGVYQSFEDDSVCWHAGDGRGPGNSLSIGLEICINDMTAFVRACEIAAMLTADLLKKHKLHISAVKQHNNWSGKNCPAEIRRGTFGVTWDGFLKMVAEYDESNFSAYTPNQFDTSNFTRIMGESVGTAEQMRVYLRQRNTTLDDETIKLLSNLYIECGQLEGVRGDIAFVQSCIETGNFNFVGGTAVTFDQNNFCGMGVTNMGMRGNFYGTPREGILAQIQHLKAYACTTPLNTPLVQPTVGEPRFRFVQRGSAEFVEWLGIQENPIGRGWAAGAGYGEKLLVALRNLINTYAPLLQPQHDVPPDWGVPAWSWGITNRITDGTRPNDTATRVEVVQLLYNLTNRE